MRGRSRPGQGHLALGGLSVDCVAFYGRFRKGTPTPPKPLLLGPPLLPGDGSVLINCFLPRLLPLAARGTFLPASLLLPAWITGSELAGSAPLTAQACGQ